MGHSSAFFLLAVLLVSGCGHVLPPKKSQDEVAAAEPLIEKCSSLKLMKEPSLHDRAASDPAAISFRWVWRRAFGSKACFRLDQTAAGAKFTVKTWPSGAPSDPLRKLNTVTDMNEGDFAKFSKLVEDSGFWRAPARVNDMGYDGATWHLEACRNGVYHGIERWCPDSFEKKIAAPWLWLLNHAGLSSVEKDWF